MQDVRASFELLSQTKMLTLLTENFLGEPVCISIHFRTPIASPRLEKMREQQHLIERDILKYMDQYDVRHDSSRMHPHATHVLTESRAQGP